MTGLRQLHHSWCLVPLPALASLGGGSKTSLFTLNHLEDEQRKGRVVKEMDWLAQISYNMRLVPA